jgi:pyridoxal 5'-phosphate synthase pdxT subunit
LVSGAATEGSAPAAGAGAAGRPAPRVGILALQGGFAAHERVLQRLGATTRQVRVPSELEGLDALVLPGGESTVMTLGIEREGLKQPLRELAAAGTPILGTCAGMIMLDRAHLGILDVLAERNAFGRQVHSFEASFAVDGVDGGPVHAIFIRAPWIAEHGSDVEVLAEVDGHPVAIRQGKILALSFHPELTGEDRLHRFFLTLAGFGETGKKTS